MKNPIELWSKQEYKKKKKIQITQEKKENYKKSGRNVKPTW